MEPMTRPCKDCGAEFDVHPQRVYDELCDDCANKEPARLERMKVLCFSTLYFYLPDDFEGGLAEALRAMADHHDSVKRGETKHPPTIERNAFDRETITLAKHESETWERFSESVAGGFGICGSVCMIDFVRGEDDEWRQMFMDLSNGEPSETVTCKDSVEEQTFVVKHIKADKPTMNQRIYSAVVLQATADQATQTIRDSPLAIVHIPEKDFEKLATDAAMEFDKVGLVPHIRFDGEHLIARGIPLVGKAFEEGARLLPVMECKVHLDGKLTIIDEAKIVRFDLLPAKDKD